MNPTVRLLFVFLCLRIAGAAWAEEVGAANGGDAPAADPPIVQVGAPEAGAPSTARDSRNRFLAFTVENMRRHYVEEDLSGQTSDGILDEEDGDIPGLSGMVRWQGPLRSAEKSALLLEAAYRIAAGTTTYRGYIMSLQTGQLMAPYRGSTDNLFSELRGRAGIVISAGDRVAAVPFAEWRNHLWFRDLGVFEETYTHDAGLLGMMLQWNPSQGTQVEVEGAWGSLLFAHIEVPDVGLSQTLGREPVSAIAITLRHALGERVSFLASVRNERGAYGASAVMNGFYEPPSTMESTTMQAGLALRY